MTHLNWIQNVQFKKLSSMFNVTDWRASEETQSTDRQVMTYRAVKVVDDSLVAVHSQVELYYSNSNLSEVWLIREQLWIDSGNWQILQHSSVSSDPFHYLLVRKEWTSL